MQGNGQDEEDAALPVRFGAFCLFGFHADMKMRRQLVNELEESATGEESYDSR